MPVTALDRRVAEIAEAEWWFFGSQYSDKARPGGGKPPQAPGSHMIRGNETMPGFEQRVWTYFKIGCYPTSDEWKAKKTQAWSAAFISFCMRQGGAGAQFPYSPSHSIYVMNAVRNRLAGRLTNTIVAFDRKEMAPTVGDLIWQGRHDPGNPIDTTGWTYEELVRHVKGDGREFPSHCDLVTEVDVNDGHLLAIGGNVKDTVFRIRENLDSGGLLVDDVHTVVIKNEINQAALMS